MENPENTERKVVPLSSGPDLVFDCSWDVGIGGNLWVAGLMLVNELDSRARYFRAWMKGKRVLELGSGTGLVGLAAARICEPAEVCLTDLDSHVECMKNNVAQNAATSTSDCVVNVKAYDWNGDASHLGLPYDFTKVSHDLYLN